MVIVTIVFFFWWDSDIVGSRSDLPTPVSRKSRIHEADIELHPSGVFQVQADCPPITILTHNSSVRQSVFRYKKSGRVPDIELVA